MVNLTMFPTKSMIDYISEINRLFPESPGNPRPSEFHDLSLLLGQHPSFYQTPHNSALANHSSSSADSLSPDYPDGALWRRDIPGSRPQRPIVGRKIIGNAASHSQNLESPSKPISGSFDSGFDSSPVKPRWQPEEAYNVTPKTNNSGNKYIQNNNSFSGSRYVQSAYELFPESNKFYDFKAPMPSSASFTPKPQNMPQTLNYSPPSPQYNPSPKRPPTYFQPTNFTHQSPQTAEHFPSNSSQSPGSNMCTFCRKNGETPVVYMTHTVRTRVGNKSIVSCPILRSHVCSTCGETGDNAHTITYCPVMRSHNNGARLQSTTITLKNTRVKSNGRRRF